MKVRTILASKGVAVETIGPEANVNAAIRRMIERGIGSLVVCDRGGQVLGVLDERDVIRAMAAHGRAFLGLSVTAVMKRAVVTCTPDHDVKQVMSMMTHQRVRHVIVVDGDDLDGIISIGDVVKHRIDAAELEVGVLRDHARVRGALGRWSSGPVR